MGGMVVKRVKNDGAAASSSDLKVREIHNVDFSAICMPIELFETLIRLCLNFRRGIESFVSMERNSIISRMLFS